MKFLVFRIKIAVLFTRFCGWLKSGDSKKNKSKGELLKAKILTDFFTKKYLPAIKNLEQKEITTENRETIWQFWDNPQGKTTPKIVESCLDSVKNFKWSFEHLILNNSTFENYTDLPGYVLDKFVKGQIDHAHFADLLRLNLLKNHGGVWMDATCYMTDFIPKKIMDEDFFVFLTGKMTLFPYAFMQNCFIRSKKGSFLCENWYLMCIDFWKNQKKTIDYFQHQLMFKSLVENDLTAKKYFEKMPHISEDETHQLSRKLLEKFDVKQWEKIKKTSFFQKTTYKVNENFDYSDTYFSKLSQEKL